VYKSLEATARAWADCLTYFSAAVKQRRWHSESRVENTVNTKTTCTSSRNRKRCSLEGLQPTRRRIQPYILLYRTHVGLNERQYMSDIQRLISIDSVTASLLVTSTLPLTHITVLSLEHLSKNLQHYDVDVT